MRRRATWQSVGPAIAGCTMSPGGALRSVHNDRTAIALRHTLGFSIECEEREEKDPEQRHMRTRRVYRFTSFEK